MVWRVGRAQRWMGGTAGCPPHACHVLTLCLRCLLAAAIMLGLLADMGGAQWRVREAAALAMGDLLQGRRWAELQPHIEQLWLMTLR